MDKITKVMVISVITNIVLSISKIIAGIFGKSGALIADGIHSFSDLSTDFVAMIGNQLSKKPADEKHPYGHGKVEYITSIIISLVILILGFSIVFKSFQREIVIPSFIVIIISFFTILVKYLLSTYMIQKGKKYQNNILLASGYESKTDVISSAIVFLSAILMLFSQTISILKYADMIAMLLVGLLIIRIGFDVLKNNISIILEEQETNEEYLDSLKKIILKSTDIHYVDCLQVLKYGSYYKLVAEVSVNPEITIMKAHQYAHEAEDRLRSFDSKIAYVTIHVNPKPSYKLIKATKNDYEKIIDYRIKTILIEENTNEVKIKEYIKNHLKEHLNNYNMIVVQKKKIGTVGYYELEANTILIEELFLEEEYRHCKIGTSILEKIISEFKDQTIILWAYKNNLQAISLYQKLGFQKIEETKERIKMRITT